MTDAHPETTATRTPATGLGSVQVEVIGSALESICDEMGEALVRTSYSPNIKERRDCTTGLFNAHGGFLAQAEHIPMHLGSLMGIVSAITDRYPLEDIREGDSFVGNDPHTGGGTHLPDIVLVTPIFVGGDLAAHLAQPGALKIDASVTGGRIIRTFMTPNPQLPGMRAVIDVKGIPNDTIYMDLALKTGTTPVTETWSYRWKVE